MNWMHRAAFVAPFATVLLFALPQPRRKGSLHKLSPPALQRKLEADARAALGHRTGLQSTLEFVRSRPNIFPAPSKRRRNQEPSSARMLPPRDRDAVRASWRDALRHALSLQALHRDHAAFRTLKDPAQREASLLIACAAFLGQYRFALEFITSCDGDRSLRALLNEPSSRGNLPQGSFDRFEIRFMDPARTCEFRSFIAALGQFKGGHASDLRAGIEDDARAISRLMPRLTCFTKVESDLRSARRAALALWEPLKVAVATWMGDTQYFRPGTALISQDQIRGLPSRLRPGDIVLQRREWFVSNLAIPGFWTHAVLYVGTPDERRAFFNDPEVTQWVRRQGRDDGDFEALLQSTYPEAYRLSVRPLEDNHLPRILESISEGAVFTTLEHSAAADSLAAMRPRLSRKERATALLRAFHYSGRPYDFDFDFVTDAALGCTELVYKSYEFPEAMARLDPQLGVMVGRPFMSANDLARQFDERCDTPDRPADFVLFLDGYESAGRAVEAGLAEFRNSWNRPKWHVLSQGAPPDRVNLEDAIRAARPPLP